MIEHDHGGHLPHGSGGRRLDLVIALGVVLISLISLVVSIQHGRTMEQLVEANRKIVVASTLPFVEVGVQNYDPDARRPVAGLVVDNAGVGPALLDWLEIRFDGKPVATSTELLKACCAPLTPANVQGYIFSTPSGRVLPAREKIRAYWFDPGTRAHNPVFEAFSRAQGRITYRGCYCSVLEDCWISSFQGERPRPVHSCKIKGVTAFH